MIRKRLTDATSQNCTATAAHLLPLVITRPGLQVSFSGYHALNSIDFHKTDPSSATFQSLSTDPPPTSGSHDNTPSPPSTLSLVLSRPLSKRRGFLQPPLLAMAGHNDPKLLFSIGNINAYHIQNGEETTLTPSGPQTLSLLMVPTSSPFSDLSNADPQSAAPEEDFYLHLHLPPELDISLPATTQVYHQPPRSYLIPRWDLGPGTGAFTRIEFPKIGTTADRVTQEDVDTFETILAQCTAFLEKAKAPTEKGTVPYNPANYAPGEGYVGSSTDKSHGQIVLVDEENGSVVGELSHGYNVVPGTDIKPGSKSKHELFPTSLQC